MTDTPLYTRRVAGVTTKDTGRPLDELLNAWPYPFALAVLTNAESNWNEHAERRRATPEHPCDTSFGIGQQSTCYPQAGIPGVEYTRDIRGRLVQTSENIEAIRVWYWDAERALGDVGPRMTKNVIDAFSALMQLDGEANPFDVLLLACCWWNSPTLGGGDRIMSARLWLASNLAEIDHFHWQNREHYRAAIDRCLPIVAADQQEDIVVTNPSQNPGTDTFPYTPPEFAPVTDLPSVIAAVQDLQRRFTIMDQQQHFQTEILRTMSRQDLTEEQEEQVGRSIVDMLDPKHRGQWRQAEPPKG